MSNETLTTRAARLAAELQDVMQLISAETQKLIDVNQCSQPAIRVIQELVCDHLGVSQAVMFSPIRSASYVYARQLAMWLCRELTAHTFTEIGGWFGGRDHGTVMFAVSAINKRRDTEPRVKAEVESLLQTGRRRVSRRAAA